MSKIDEFWSAVASTAKNVSYVPVEIACVTSKKPFAFVLNDVEIGEEYGDVIYINHLLLDDNINLDVPSMDSAQNLEGVSPAPWIAQGAANSDFTANVSGTQKQFLSDFYAWTKAVHQRFILSINDSIAVQRQGDGSYAVLEKVQKIEQ